MLSSISSCSACIFPSLLGLSLHLRCLHSLYLLVPFLALVSSVSMCNKCRYYQCFVQGCADGRGPRSESPPTPPARIVCISLAILTNYSSFHTNPSLMFAQASQPVYPEASRASGSRSSVYPGSSSQSSRPGSARTGTTGAASVQSFQIQSNASERSFHSIASADSYHSIASLASELSAELYPRAALATELRAWQATIQEQDYQPNLPWRPEVQAAYDGYYEWVNKHQRSHQAYLAYFHQTNDKFTSAEENLERARLALQWGQDALR